MKKEDKIYVAGHRGMVGSAVVRKLKQEGYENLVLKFVKPFETNMVAITFLSLQANYGDSI